MNYIYHIVKYFDSSLDIRTDLLDDNTIAIIPNDDLNGHKVIIKVFDDKMTFNTSDEIIIKDMQHLDDLLSAIYCEYVYPLD